MLYLSGSVQPDLPAMLSLGMGNLPPAGLPWAADSGRFNQPQLYSDERYLAWLTRHLPNSDRCLFATAPDVVGDAQATLELSLPLVPALHALGYPVALVAQDGLLPDMVPWDSFEAIFIGGTTRWKLSHEAHQLIQAARGRGKWAHMGRVNSLRRFRAAAAMGCHSCDGTKLAFGPQANRAQVDRWLADMWAFPSLWHQPGDDTISAVLAKAGRLDEA